MLMCCIILLLAPSRLTARYDHVPSSFDWTAEPSLREFLVDHSLSSGFLPGCVKRLILDETAQLKIFALNEDLGDMEVFVGLPQQEFPTHQSCLLHVLWLEDDSGLATHYLQQAVQTFPTGLDKTQPAQKASNFRIFQVNQWQTRSSDFYLLLFGQKIGTTRAKEFLPSLAGGGNFLNIAIVSHFNDKVENLLFYKPEISFSGNITSVTFLTSWRQRKRDQLRIDESMRENKTELRDISMVPLREEIFQDRLLNMRGKALRVTYLNAFPHVWERKNKAGRIQMVGWEVQLLKEIAQRRNFTIVYIKPPDGKWGSWDKEKQKWTGMLGQVANGEADLAISAHRIFPDALVALDFSTSLGPTASTFIIQKPGQESRWKSLILPFQWPVWILAAVTWFTAAICNWLLARYGISQPLHLPSDFMGQALKLSMSRHMENKQKTRSHAPRIWRMSWLFFAYITTLCYASLLISFLAIPRQRKPIDRFEDLATSDYFVMVERGSLEHQIIQDSTDSKIGPLNEKMLQQPPDFTYLENETDGIENVLKNDQNALIYNRDILEVLVKTSLFPKEQEIIHISRENFMESNYAWPVRKGAAWISSFNEVLIGMSSFMSSIRGCMEAGLLDRWKEESIQQYRKLEQTKGNNETAKNETTTESDDINQSLQLIHFQGAFIILALGCAMATVAFIDELCVYAKEKADAMKRDFIQRNQRILHQFPRSE
ncbi:unnamed protein product [Darwinula stevensoni]|uniref:Ionotropic glutamate receptor L-glutamate and glycine-binding domain-containing protein n=1 Tax=Darwinula stevensoni TaxID=69355 RepID=A0A7R8XB00_9CRUS|nr:unnamed protein product [Darwinula stevensoni]CAG0892374.1 unnamed protein product [Darwinula stevensoni]